MLQTEFSVLHLVTVSSVFGTDGGLPRDTAEGIALGKVQVTNRRILRRGGRLTKSLREEFIMGLFRHMLPILARRRAKTGIA